MLTLRNITLGFGGPPLLDGVGLEVEAGERIALVGQNGTGKSTLLGVLAGSLPPDEGQVVMDPGLRVASLPQQVPEGLVGRVREVVAGGLAGSAELLREHERLASRSADPTALAALDTIQRRIEAAGSWDLEARVSRTLSRLELDPEERFETLSGGRQRRALLARALAAEPDLLLLDEPTNHLDLDTIEWLEGLLGAWRGTVLFTTHDRRFLDRVATRILELDRGALTSWPGDWAIYLRRRDERQAAEAEHSARQDRKLAQEEVWIRQGIRARRTRNEGRVRRLQALRRQQAARRERTGSARFEAQAASASGRLVVEATEAAFAYGQIPVIEGLDVLVERGDRVGVIGPNGSGKTTLLRLLLGELEPTAGEVRLGTRLEVAYFDQHRAQLDPDATLVEAVADGADTVRVGDANRHVIGYLGDFLFPPERARSPVRALSGGERARLLLARLFARPSNLLVMDEPTNDLDVETLEMLEERLAEYPGTLLLVSHDRAFLDNVATSTLVLEGEGRVGEYVGGYEDWLRQRRPAETKPAAAPPTKQREPAPARRRLGYMETRELEALPERIEALEQRLESLNARLADPALYRDGGAEIGALRAELAEANRELEEAYSRWSELEAVEAGKPDP